MPTLASSRVTNGSKQTKHRKRWTRRIVFAFFIFVGLVVLLESPLTRIRHIVVTGQSGSETTVIQDSGLRTGMSLWQVNAGAVTHNIMTREPLVEKVSVKTDYLAGTVRMGITQKSVVAVFGQAGNFYSLLNDGTAYQSVKQAMTANLPLVQTDNSKATVKVGTVLSIPGLVTLCQQLQKTPTNEVQSLSQIILNPYGDVTMYLDNGFAVQTGAAQVQSTLSAVPSVVAYFTSRGDGPGEIDMTGQPPYRYTPFQALGTSATGATTNGSTVKGSTTNASTSGKKGQ